MSTGMSAMLEAVIDETKISLHPKHDLARDVWVALPRLAPNIPDGIGRSRLMKAIGEEVNSLPADVTKASAMRCAQNAAALGLYPGSALGHCHFVPFTIDRGKRTERREATLIIGYRGMMHLAYACGHLAGLSSNVVLAGEKAKLWTTSDGPRFHHEIPLDRGIPTLKDIVCAYCQYRTAAGVRNIVVVPGARLRAIGGRQKNVWLDEPEEMSKKTAIRRAAKLWQWFDTGSNDVRTSAVARLTAAAMLDEQAERGAVQSQLTPDVEALGLVSKLDLSKVKPVDYGEPQEGEILALTSEEKEVGDIPW